MNEEDPTRGMLAEQKPGVRLAGDAPGGIEYIAVRERADRARLGLPPIGAQAAPLKPCSRCGGSGVEPS